MGKKSRSKQQQRQNKGKTQGTPAQILVPTMSVLGSKLASTPSSRATSEADYSYVRSDIRRILVLLVIIVAIMISGLIVNTRSTLLRRAGSSVAHFIGLQ